LISHLDYKKINETETEPFICPLSLVNPVRFSFLEKDCLLDVSHFEVQPDLALIRSILFCVFQSEVELRRSPAALRESEED